MTLIEPLLSILPKPLQCLRIGPLALPATYSARDWFITNSLCFWIAYLYYALNYKQSSVCGPPDGWAWSVKGKIDGQIRSYPSEGDGLATCDEFPQTIYEDLFMQLNNKESDNFSLSVGLAGVFLIPLLITCLLACMARKLPGWGEPPIGDGAPGAQTSSAVAPAKEGGQGSTAKKVANAAKCVATTAAATAGGVAVVGSTLEEAGSAVEKGVAASFNEAGSYLGKIVTA